LATDYDSVVIAGAGQAGAWVAITLRSCDPHRRIGHIGDEPCPPYERPPLSKAVLARKASIKSACIKSPDFYAANQIELMLGRRAARIHRSGLQVEIDDGSHLSYGTLVLVMGTKARLLPIAGPYPSQLQVLRSATNVERIRPQLATGKRAVAVGAGFIGLEFAAIASEIGCSITVIDTAPHFDGTRRRSSCGSVT
jgi:3-phenylpropionate/trans-cinnamate dioxygenase ferredoxin reductase subunit